MNDIQQKKIERYVKGWPFMTSREQSQVIDYIVDMYKEQISEYRTMFEQSVKTVDLSKQLIEELQMIRNDQQKQLDMLHEFIGSNESIRKAFGLYEVRHFCDELTKSAAEAQSGDK